MNSVLVKIQWKFLIFLFISTLILVTFIHLLYNYQNRNYIKQTFKPKWQPKINKTILFWGKFFGRADFGFGPESKMFNTCEVRTCVATYNRSFLPVEDFDAVLFHGARYSLEKDGKPKSRSQHQKYIFYNLESYYNSNFDSKTSVNFYNWTMTYKRDSDIFAPYGELIEKTTNYKLPTTENLRKRTKKVAWFVSNCHNKGTSRRNRYVKELSKYIPVDIYGACGTLKCPRTDENACYKMLEQNYKFYLSFENSLCEDYVTEKVYKILELDVVPIVFSFVDYDALFPKQSLINANQFINPKHLAEYLLELERNDTEYLKYFEWKKKYVVRKKYDLCDVCKKLHDPLVNSSYENIKDWFFGYNCVT